VNVVAVMLIGLTARKRQVDGVNSLDKRHLFEKYLREAAVLPLYDAGNFSMQRRRVHGVLADPRLRPAGADGRRARPFDKAMGRSTPSRDRG
jgi:nitroalkane oxidase